MPEIVLARHGDTEWTDTGQHTGVTDVDLTDAGRRGAVALGEALRGRSFVVVLTSPRRRARDTCALAGLGEQARVDDDLAEWDYGDYEGRTTPDIRKERPGWNLWRDGVPGGEAACDVAARADRVLSQLDDIGGDAVLFSHGHFLRVLAARWLGLGPEDGRLLGPLAPASLGVLGHERENRVVAVWNRTSDGP